MCQNESDVNLNLMASEFASDGRKLKNVSVMYTVCLLTHARAHIQGVSDIMVKNLRMKTTH
jgi:hypothetical protein